MAQGLGKNYHFMCLLKTTIQSMISNRIYAVDVCKIHYARVYTRCAMYALHGFI